MHWLSAAGADRGIALVGQSIAPAVARKLTWRHAETILAVAAWPPASER